MFSLREVFLRLAVAAALGAIIGIERDLRRRPAGMRTSLFVCLATALFTILSGEISRLLGDTGSTRIASNIVQGIGFLGAGAILREGGGLFAVATYTTALALFGLVGLGWLAERFDLKCRPMVFRFTTSHAENVAIEVQRLMAQMKVPMQHFRASMAGENSIVEFQSVVSDGQQESIVAQLNRQGVITEVTAVEDSRE